MNSALRLLPILTLVFLALFLSPGVFAQSLNDSSYGNPQPYLQNGTINQTAPISPNMGNSSLALDWRFVLPIAIVAIGAFLLRGSRKPITRRYYTPSSNYVTYQQISRKNGKFKKPLKAA